MCVEFSHRIHIIWYICLHLPCKIQLNVGIYASPMDGMGYEETSILMLPSELPSLCSPWALAPWPWRVGHSTSIGGYQVLLLRVSAPSKKAYKNQRSQTIDDWWLWELFRLNMFHHLWLFKVWPVFFCWWVCFACCYIVAWESKGTPPKPPHPQSPRK